MTKMLQLLSFLALGTLLLLSITMPDAPAVWLAATSQEYNFVRGLLMTILFVLLVTHPPRNVYFRQFVAVVAIVMGGWSASQAYQNYMMILDGLSILAASISMWVAVLEYQPEDSVTTFLTQRLLHSA